MVGTIALLTTLLGDILGISSAEYAENGMDGTLEIDTSNPEKDIYRLDMNSDFEDLKNKEVVQLIVNPHANLKSQE